VSAISITPVILSGGAGTRLWPLSHGDMPKQFHALASERTMLQDTALRITSGNGVRFEAPVVICAQPHRAEIVRQLAEVGVTAARIVLEPFGRNTAAAAYIAAAVVAELSPGSLALLLPADHVIADPSAFRQAMAEAAETARGRIVTFGITPDGPETGYGYIQQGPRLDGRVFEVARFAEKPSRTVAEAYLAEGGYSWNAGIFLFAPSVMMAEMATHAPAIAEKSLLALTRGRTDGPALELDPEAFAACPSEPVDIAVMEKTILAAVIPCVMGWADVGSWSELHRLGPHDASGNLLHGSAVAIDTANILVWADGPPVAVVGLSDIAVISTPQGVMVLPLSRSQDVKLALAAVKMLGA
jgi:mannose-1-phosphate guanylyltransferase/mannose-6-phosphate isomerase